MIIAVLVDLESGYNSKFGQAEQVKWPTRGLRELPCDQSKAKKHLRAILQRGAIVLYYAQGTNHQEAFACQQQAVSCFVHTLPGPCRL